MKQSGQRQDVVFLALAVSVLAIAVALFVVMRSIPRERPKAPPEKTEQAPTKEPIKTSAPTTAGARDPFRSQAQAGGKGGPVEPQAELRLVGITRSEGKEPIAVIYRGTRRYHVRVGARVAGYTVANIGDEQVVLQGEGGPITLAWSRSAEEESAEQ